MTAVNLAPGLRAEVTPGQKTSLFVIKGRKTLKTLRAVTRVCRDLGINAPRLTFPIIEASIEIARNAAIFDAMSRSGRFPKNQLAELSQIFEIINSNATKCYALWLSVRAQEGKDGN